MRRRLLIVSPHFPPSNAADEHRVRLILPHFAANGWDAEVLAVKPEYVAAPFDQWLNDGIPSTVLVHRVSALSLRWRWMPGLGGLGWRAYCSLAHYGDRILTARHFDLIYFSTTVFEVHLLALRWKKKFRVRYIIDYQDPWVNNYYKTKTNIKPPGGRIKYLIYRLIHKQLEPKVLRECIGITAVSQDYPQELVLRYPWFAETKVLVQPFPGSDSDYRRLATVKHLSNADGYVHWVYVGRGGPDMEKAISSIFFALSAHAPKALLTRLKFKFIGTSYVANAEGEKLIEAIAIRMGLADIVSEEPNRVAYSSALSLLKAADALIMPGSDDGSYIGSKLIPYLLARRPLLVVCHERSPMVSVLEMAHGAVCITYSDKCEISAIGGEIAGRWLNGAQYMKVVPLNEEYISSLDERRSTESLCEFFADCLTDNTGGAEL